MNRADSHGHGAKFFPFYATGMMTTLEVVIRNEQLNFHGDHFVATRF
jgi:hypothetical protein